ncbi:hypothetical protein [Kibdelosporangium aridum]|uniref:Uncharacterized protein n=1 Tax=Kibdelosporangium aridum TaxID=2030 RepID=A0A1W2EY25_KIBAR|nr:hypothetical protein [Kibdelosporangium aridum]SMD14599.1 hypothetical protein SAMN05661093_05076 [Kibdelosporangium aridum]
MVPLGQGMDGQVLVGVEFSRESCSKGGALRPPQVEHVAARRQISASFLEESANRAVRHTVSAFHSDQRLPGLPLSQEYTSHDSTWRPIARLAKRRGIG